MLSSEVPRPVLGEPSGSGEIAQDACMFSFPLLAGYPISWPKHVCA
jgi:hypothetical protein